MNRKSIFTGQPLILLLLVSLQAFSRAGKYTVQNLGNDAETNTGLIQRQINACSERGGGTVSLPATRVVSGTILLKNGVTLYLPKGCTLVGDTNPRNFPTIPSSHSWYKGREGHHQRALIVAMGQSNIGIAGKGCIDGQGSRVYKAWSEHHQDFRWMNIWMQNCRSVEIRDISLTNSPSWMQLYQMCSNLKIKHIQVKNYGARNNDGLDLDGCTHVFISGCTIDSDDDALVLKSLSSQPMEDVVIDNCVLASCCNALKVGTESEGNIRSILIRNIRIKAPSEISPMYRRKVGISGIALAMVDGGELSEVSLQNFRIEGVKIPFFIRQGTRNRRSSNTTAKINSRIRNVRFTRIQADWDFDLACHVTAVDSGSIEKLEFEHLRLHYHPVDSNRMGSVRSPIPDLSSGYPEATMFGKGLPEVLLFASGVQDISLKNCLFTESTRRQSLLPSFYAVKCAGISSD